MNDPDINENYAKIYSNLIYTAIDRRLRGYGITLAREEILDIRQEVLISICEGKKLDKIRDPASIPYWIAIVSGNTAMQYMRKQRRIETERPISLFDKAGASEMIGLIPSSGPCASEELERDELSRKIDAAIESLPEKEKLIIKLNLLHDKKYEEIAEILKIPRGTVASYIKRAKERLKKRLKDFA